MGLASRLKAAFCSALSMFAVLGAAAAAPSQALAQGGANLFQQEKYAAVVVDASSGEVLYARRADEPRYPASITKVMTLYLTFEALATGRLSPGDKITVSTHAWRQAPSKLGLRPGEQITVDAAIRAITVLSANDIAVAMAERIGGNEPHFAELMTLRARELGMDHTHFANANGLPNPKQLTTARDIAILSRAVMRDYPQYYSYFGVKEFQYQGREITNHNHLLGRVEGVDGLKTGYTGAAGFNLAASAKRNGKRLIAVVLGGSSTAARDENVEDLINGGFEVLTKRAKGERITLASTLHEPADSAAGPVTRPPTEMGSGDQQGLKIVLGDNTAPTLSTLPPSLSSASATAPAATPPGGNVVCTPAHGRGRHHHRAVCTTAGAHTAVAHADCGPVRKHGKHHRAAVACASSVQSAKASEANDGKGGKYLVQVGVFPTSNAARAKLAALSGRFSNVLNDNHQVEKAGKGKFRARFGGFDKAEAKQACHTLSAKGVNCMVIAGS